MCDGESELICSFFANAVVVVVVIVKKLCFGYDTTILDSSTLCRPNFQQFDDWRAKRRKKKLQHKVNKK